MPTNIQATVNQGDEIELEVVLTAHHKGHFSFYACPVASGAIPTDECFKQNPLEFVADLLYGAPKDKCYPHRAYIPPLSLPSIVTDKEGPVHGTLFRYQFKIPEAIQGDLVLVQWHYLNANACTHDGYEEYSFPSDWPDQGYSSIPKYTNVPEDGDGDPDQFWNCIELSIESGEEKENPIPSMESPPTTSPTTDAPTGATTPYPSKAPIGSTVSSPTFTPTVSKAEPTVSKEGYELSTPPRCGKSEFDARGNCGTVCATTNNCDVGEWCWSVHGNFCDSKPSQVICLDLSSGASSGARCGVDELHARELCGKPCVTSEVCAGTEKGENCWSVHANTCDC